MTVIFDDPSCNGSKRVETAGRENLFVLQIRDLIISRDRFPVLLILQPIGNFDKVT